KGRGENALQTSAATHRNTAVLLKPLSPTRTEPKAGDRSRGGWPWPKAGDRSRGGRPWPEPHGRADDRRADDGRADDGRADDRRARLMARGDAHDAN